MKIAIVIAAYNRPKSLKRILERLELADYCGDNVDLIISIDNSGSDEVYNVANEFKWLHGELVIKKYEKRLGLKAHILKCGNITKDYDAIIMFEDDIFPSQFFYMYTKQAVEFFDGDENIAGISLYQHLWNVGSNLDFIPACDGYDNYFVQYAQSWGQVWTKRMWNEFYEWYERNSEPFDNIKYLPDNVNKWPKTSWLKYFIRYVVEKNKFFVYPRVALATNFGDTGQHNVINTSHYQVQIQSYRKEFYNFSRLEDSDIKYDVYFERVGLGKYLDIDESELVTDLYGLKNRTSNNKFLLTLNKEDYEVVKSFALTMRPHENNIMFNIEGKDIFLYDTTINCENKSAKVKSDIKRIIFHVRDVKIKTIIKLLVFNLDIKIKNKLKKFIKRVKGK